ncbi:MAG: SAM-dependent methyltransferase [Hydrogenophilaceae bacterium]|jgi:NADH dehydrogenase [ubiquinone] 1 alpha subcomplex assembly factor 7|nr:SAM-dependent methyltransferase [Hydrogenophilaceae bacterium]
MTPLKRKLIAQIRADGPLTIAQFMAAGLYDPQHGYYARAPLIGEDGDFITAPEISQMFGELIGLWCVNEWEAMGRPETLQLVEFGPGRGLLIADAWRACRIRPAFQAAAQITLIEINKGLQRAQREALAGVGAHAEHRVALEDVPEGPTLILMNEFLDCLPVREFIHDAHGWRERVVGVTPDDPDEIQFGLGGAIDAALLPAHLRAGEEGDAAEFAPGLSGWIDQIAARLAANPGRALIIDYATDGRGHTLQAMAAHEKVHPLQCPGEADLTACVDLAYAASLARAAGLAAAGPIGQGEFLNALGIEARAATLSRAHPESAASIARGRRRLTHADEMGALFQALCLSTPQLPAPAGF